MVKNPAATLETRVRSLGWEDPLEKGKATHSSILAWRIPKNCIIRGGKKNQTRLSDFHFDLPVYWGDPLSTIGSEYFYESISTPSVAELFLLSILYLGIVGWGFPDGWAVNNPPAIQVMKVRSLSQEDPMAKEMSTHSSILPREISWTEESGRLQWGPWGHKTLMNAPGEQEKDSAILYMYQFSSNPFFQVWENEITLIHFSNVKIFIIMSKTEKDFFSWVTS